MKCKTFQLGSVLLPVHLANALDDTAAVPGPRSPERNPLNDATQTEVREILESIWHLWPGPREMAEPVPCQCETTPRTKKWAQDVRVIDPDPDNEDQTGTVTAVVAGPFSIASVVAIPGTDTQEGTDRDRAWADTFVELRDSVKSLNRAARKHGDTVRSTAAVCRCGWSAYGRLSSTGILGLAVDSCQTQVAKHREDGLEGRAEKKGCKEPVAHIGADSAQIPNELRQALVARDAEAAEAEQGGEGA